MTKREVIRRLEALLQRVRTRSTEQRRERAEPLSTTGVLEVSGTLEGGETDATEGAPEVRPSDGYDSRERLVAAERPGSQRAAPPPVADVLESGPPVEMVDVEVLAEVEEPPASSRRTVASQPEERLEQMAFGAEEQQGPLHTPPPESGRLPAAPAAEYDTDVTGVRNATPLLPRRGTATPDLLPDAIRPQLLPSDAVAEVIAEAQRFAPSTFIALLDASLSL